MRKILRDKKAISTILAALLMVVIVVVASVMVYAWSTGLLGALMGGTPEVGQENLLLDSATWVNASAFDLNFRNKGQIATTITGYYIRDMGGTGTYQRGVSSGTFSGPTIPVDGVRMVTITVSGGSWSGTSFNFLQGSSYRIQVQTAQGTLLPEVQVPK